MTTNKRIWRHYDLDFFKLLAVEKMGICLSDEYLGVQTALRFQCSQGHQFETKPTYLVHKGHWCPECGGQFYGVHQLSTFQVLARNKGGQCLSTEYVGITKYLKFRCAFGHEWQSRGGNILHNGSWCPKCAHGEKRGVVTGVTPNSIGKLE